MNLRGKLGWETRGPHVAGVDEAGRGPLAGPVTAACVVFPPEYANPEIVDSKRLSPKKRERLFEEICSHATAYSVISVGPRRIEKLNIREASRLAMKLAVERVHTTLNGGKPCVPLHLLIDGNVPIETLLPQRTIIKGDQRVMSISAASILAKVTRDRLMKVLDNHYPGYGFSAHKGYPTKTHREAVAEKGPTRIHRRTFAGVREHVSRA